MSEEIDNAGVAELAERVEELVAKIPEPKPETWFDNLDTWIKIGGALLSIVLTVGGAVWGAAIYKSSVDNQFELQRKSISDLSKETSKAFENVNAKIDTKDLIINGKVSGLNAIYSTIHDLKLHTSTPHPTSVPMRDFLKLQTDFDAMQRTLGELRKDVKELLTRDPKEQ